MTEYAKLIEIRWSDLDPNFHLRHSVYYDYGAYCRICFLEEYGLTNSIMQDLAVGPILFREEGVFRKEVRLGDPLRIDLQLVKSKADFSRWTIRHQLIKNTDILAATVTVDGAWINTRLRKLATPPKEVLEVFEMMPKAAEWHSL